MKEIVLLCDGEFPERPELVALMKKLPVVCCDGSAAKLLGICVTPCAIVGDMDSLSSDLQEQYASLIHRVSEQDSNDLYKAFRWCLKQGYEKIHILGATGLREDHMLGNMSLCDQLAREYSELEFIVYSGYGCFVHVKSGRTSFKTYRGQVISIFDWKAEARITSQGLDFGLNKLCLKNLSSGTLNRASGDEMVLEVEGGELMVFLSY